MKDAIGADVFDAYLDRDLLLVLEDENTVINLKPDQKKTEQLDGVTAKGDGLRLCFPYLCTKDGRTRRFSDRQHSLHDHTLLV
nr:hypothetical protein [Sharpea porci]